MNEEVRQLVHCCILALVALASMPSSLHASQPTYRGFVCEVAVANWDTVTGVATLTLSYRPEIEGDDEAIITLIGLEGIRFLDDTVWHESFEYLGPTPGSKRPPETVQPLGDYKSVTRLVRVAIEQSDTAGIRITFDANGRFRHVDRYLHVQSDTLVVSAGRPGGPVYPPRPEVIEEFQRRFPQSIQDSSIRRSAKPRSDSPSKFEVKLGSREDGAPESRWSSDETKRLLAEMRAKEAEPLTEYPVEVYVIDTLHYIRHRGESKFHLNKPIRPEDEAEYYAELRDSLEASFDPTKTYEVAVDLRAPEAFDQARRIIGELRLTDLVGVYRATIPWPELFALIKARIHYIDTEARPDWREQILFERSKDTTEGETGESTGTSTKKGGMKSSVIFFDPMSESTFPNWWNGMADDCEIVFWGPTSYGDWSGSVWCAGSTGDAGQVYPSGICPVFKSDEPIDLTGVEPIIYLGYQVYCDLDPDESADYMQVEYSINGSSYVPAMTYSESNTNGWLEEAWPLAIPSPSQLYLRFHFHSFPTAYPKDGRGAFIDNVYVWGDLPNLAGFTPSGWDDAIVFSNNEGTHTNDDDLYEGDDIYVDMAFINAGDASASGVTADVYLDGEWIAYDFIEDWPAGEAGYVEDYAISTTWGWHDLEVVLDESDCVRESNESDNTISRSFHVQDNTIAYEGYLFYYDPVPGDAGMLPARDILMVMYDDNGILGLNQQAECVTASDGYFFLGPVQNEEIWKDTASEDTKGSKLDIVIHAYADNDACQVWDGEGGELLYYSSPTWDEHASGRFWWVPILNEEEGAPFMVADVILDAEYRWNSLSLAGDYGKASVVLHDSVAKSHFDAESMCIHIPESNGCYFCPDWFDRSVLCHEWAHWIEFSQGFLDSAGGPHHWFESLGARLAATEGYAHFLSCWLLETPESSNWNHDFSIRRWVNVENGTLGENELVDPNGSMTCKGLEWEAAVSGLFGDLLDDTGPEDDCGEEDAYGIHCLDVPDGIYDQISVPIDTIMEPLLSPDRYINGDFADNMYEYWDAWFTVQPHLGHPQEMRDTWYEHGYRHSVDCCSDLTGDVNSDGVGPDIADLVHMVSYMFQPPSAPPTCDGGNAYYPEADFNGDGSGPDIADLIYAVNYLWQPPNPAPMPCRAAAESKAVVAGHVPNADPDTLQPTAK